MLIFVSRSFRPLRSVSNLLSPSYAWTCTRSKSFLSQDFKCQDVWNERLQSPIFSRLEMSKYFFEIERKFQLEGRGSAVDVEIFSNAALMSPTPLNAETRQERLEQLRELLRRFRNTEQTCLMMPSTHHAVVRAFVDGDDTDTLMTILNGRVEFGVFTDDYSNVYLLHHFLSTENFRDASRVAVAMMLQEEYNVPIASQMALYSTFSYVQNLKDASEPWDPQPPPVPVEPEDEVKIRVPFLESSYRDDHFDLIHREHLLGKTLVKFASHGLTIGSADALTIRKSLQILGWTLFEKWDKVVELCSNNKDKLDEDCVKQAQASASESNAGDESVRMKAIDSLGLVEVVDFDVRSFLEAEVVKSVQENESKIIQRHCETLRAWNNDREAELSKQYQLFLKESRIKELEKAKLEMAKMEEELFFFDNYDKMEKEKSEKFAEWQKTWPRRTWARQIKMSNVENHNKFKMN